MSRCVIIGGAEIKDYDVVRRYFRADDWFCYCDSGLLHMEPLGAAPALIIGDFDSHPNPDLPVETIVLPREKDDTDTVYAVREAVRRGADAFLLVGVTGQRLDHTIGNLSILLWLDTLGKSAMIVDDYAEMEIISRQTASIPDSFAWFSLLSICGTARGITVRNAKFPLHDAEIGCEYQYGISNEVTPGRTATVTVAEGRLLLIKTRN
jgi:thiamine pyrophosphokinase